VTTVRPAESRRSASVIRRSVAGSTADVASSRISSPGSPICARARATSWRSPTLSASPRSPTGVASPSGNPATQSANPSSTNADSTSGSVAVGLP